MSVVAQGGGFNGIEQSVEEGFFAMRHAAIHPHLNPPPRGGGDFFE